MHGPPVLHVEPPEALATSSTLHDSLQDRHLVRAHKQPFCMDLVLCFLAHA
jgi:hypothetical protein